jgi:hypothetical protein
MVMAVGDLTTSAEVIAYLQTRPNISIDPALIATLITNASAFIKTYCDDNFLSQAYTELFDGDTSGSLGLSGWPAAGWPSSSFGRGVRPVRYVLAYRPITAIASVTVNGTPIQSAGSAPYQQGYIVDKTKLTILGIYVPPTPACVQVAYTAGFIVAPADINQACVELVAQKYLQRRRMGISSEAVSQVGSRTYTKADLQADTKTILQQHRRVSPPMGNVISP